MCLIIARDRGGVIPPDYLTNGSARNPDGWGVMWATKERLNVAKGTDHTKLADGVKQAGKASCVVHLRYATHGVKTVENCHPFLFADGLYALAHNGVISIEQHDRNRSDTWHFVHDIVEPMLVAAPSLFDSPDFPKILASIVGIANKLVLMRADGKTVFVNREEGVEQGSLWLSNTYSIAPVATPVKSLWTANHRPHSLSRWSWDEEDRLREIEDEDLALATERHNRYVEDAIPLPRDIFDCDALERDDLIDLCRTEPEAMADMIIDSLDWLRQSTD